MALLMPQSPLVALVAAALAAAPTEAQEAPRVLPEYVVKAGFLYNFAKYVEWPAAAFERDDEPISIGVVGSDPFGSDLEGALANKTVKRRTFVVRRFPTARELAPCRILFVARSESSRIGEISEKARRWGSLTVGEAEGFSAAGGIINILIDDDIPRLEVNAEEAKRAGLTIDSKLLKLATIVSTED
jgi:hypothetical protein